MAGNSLTVAAPQADIRYVRDIDAFRALGRLLGELSLPDASRSITENPDIHTVGIMLDVSRNGVLLPDVVKQMLTKVALMGINCVMLYTEDVYEIPGEPFFGYLRGAYSFDELQQIDQHAAALGIEMVPCIQTLGHLEQILKWPEYSPLQDVYGVLLPEESTTYELIEKMIRAASAPFRSRRIHLGMDETHGVGTGKFLKRFGPKDSYEIFNNHLKQTNAICQRLGLSPMIWSDMYFRFASLSENYYEAAPNIPPQVSADIPPGVRLVYWDYYHTDPSFYENRIRTHHRLQPNPIMATGIWTWNRFWAALPFSFATIEACLEAIRKTGVSEVFATTWGDDATECDPFSALPGFQYLADLAYQPASTDHEVTFRGSCESSFASWILASKLDAVPGSSGREFSANNISKWLLWDDPLLGIAQPHRPITSLQPHYAQLSADLKALASAATGDHRLLFPAQIAEVLTQKCDMRDKIIEDYRKRDLASLNQTIEIALPCLREAIQRLWSMHKDLWHQAFKSFGWEVIEVRYGGLLARLTTLEEKLRAFTQGSSERIEEFETTLRPFIPAKQDELPILNYRQVATASMIR